MRGLVEKFGEKLVNRALDIFEQKLDQGTEDDQCVGVCKVMYNMASASSHRLLVTISPRIISIMEMHLASEVDIIREWTVQVFTTMLKRVPDKNYTEPLLKRIILDRLRMNHLEGKSDDSERLIWSLKLLLNHTKELKLQDKLLKLCEIVNRETPFSIAQAQVLKAIAPTIAKFVYHKRLYTGVMYALEEELNAETIDNKDRIQHVLMAYAELMSQIPKDDVAPLSETLTKFASDCRDNDRPEFYVDFIGHFCANTRCDIEVDSISYLENVMRYMNNSEKGLIEKVISAMNAIINKVSKETQFAFVPVIRQAVEAVCT